MIKRYHAPEPPALSHGAVSEADKARLAAMLAAADPVLLLVDIRAAQADLGKRVDERGAGAERAAEPAPVNLERFTASLKVAWSAGERRPTHRRSYIRRKPLVRSSIMDGVREQITAWLEVQPALSAVAVLERLHEADPVRFRLEHKRTVQRFVKLRRALMARDVLLGTLPPRSLPEPQVQPA